MPTALALVSSVLLALAVGAEVTGSTPEEFAAFMRAEIAKWGKVTSRLKLRVE